ncbi:hypothetical protein YMSE1_27290 [Lactiplantibacillus plantarum]|uniref:hypothetical protein n=1 Tax=Lactiplantibacillus plantarum TaxID=1590 RepID=UPI000976527B|nr:hypothetical protein [Lactiplantibacillus plantarum]MBO2713187.1 hypothetical protein [Lactiplantibacillus plantarum]MCG0834698.1 prophage P2a protein 33 [Lactiplantibacillus plantarum]MCT0222535.1 hypothetical protein [Lactiplantibacillus plantarum]MCW6117446.1 hypothetical protein [Lactiplantibacillus plantarum]
MRAQKKPVVIEYWQVTDLDIDDKVPAWIFNAMADRVMNETRDGWDISTLEGKMHANVGDYIIKEVHGDLYLRRPNIFKETAVIM